MITLVNDTINRDDINSLIQWLSQDKIPRLTKGELTIKLEKKWAEIINTKYCVYVNSGSSAILLALAAFLHSKKIKNKKIVVPSLSWATDVSSPILLGMQPIMCDCNLHDLSCDLNHLEKIFKEENPSAFILVSPLGLVPDMNGIIELCNRYDVTLFEDVCESMGSKYNQRYLGSFGYASFFSMYFGHHLSTIEGGFINTNDDDFYHLLLMMRSHGWDRDLPTWKQKELRNEYSVDDFSALYNFYVPGFNLRATDLQAFIGLRALDKLDDYSMKRNKNFFIYNDNINNNELNIMVRPNDFISNFAYPMLNKNRKKIINDLILNDVEVRPLIAGDMSQKPMWMNQFGVLNLSNSSKINEFGFYLPNHQDLTENEIIKITEIINNYI